MNVDVMLRFLKAVDRDFPVPLSQKQDLEAFARKLCEKATICAVMDGEEIAALAAGYTDHMVENRAYLSILAVRADMRGQGYATRLLREFVDISAQKGADAVHAYAVASNLPAIRVYQKLGFARLNLPDEPRPQDAHLILELGGEKR